MGITIIQALFFFLPAYAANAAPVIFDRMGWWKRAAVPVDGGMTIGGKRLFGENKTWRGVFSGVLTGAVVALSQFFIHETTPWREWIFLFRYTPEASLLLGLLMGLGEGMGDMLKSTVKRMIGVKSGAPAFPIDQTSFLGALLASFVIHTPSNAHLAVILILSPLIPVIANMIAYKAGWKKVWW